MNAMTTTMSLRVAPVGARKTRAVRGTAALRAPGNKMSLSRGRAVAARASSEPRSEEKTLDAGRLALLATVASNPILFGAQEAFAKGGEYGLAEGRIISLAHPVAMGGCFLATLYAGYTGLQWRMLRELGVELKEARAAAAAAQKAVQEHAGAGASDEEALAPPPPSLVQAASDADATVAALTEKRSVIQAGNFRDRHYQLGTILLAVGIPMALEGPVNTYMRAGKLFPGPHVYAGVGVASLWAIAAALVPEMQKGKEWARTAHIGVNAVTFGLFAYYQIPTGLEIAAKVIEKTKFP